MKKELLAQNTVCCLEQLTYGGGTTIYRIIDRAFRVLIRQTNNRAIAERQYKAYTNMPQIHRAELMRQSIY